MCFKIYPRVSEDHANRSIGCYNDFNTVCLLCLSCCLLLV